MGVEMKRIAVALSSFVLCAPLLLGQQLEVLTPWQEPPMQLPGKAAPPTLAGALEPNRRNGPTAGLYRALQSVGLDESKVFHVREAVLDRGELHLYLTDGTIAFTQGVSGRITGAYFVGEGEVLLRPPNLTERASLGLFSGLGVLNEHFGAAYLRFNSDLLEKLRPYLREPEDEDRAEFIHAHEQLSHELAEMDGLRLLESFTEDATLAKDDQYLHARLATRLGSLDVYYDSQAEDQFKVACLSGSKDAPYLDIWMAFSGREARKREENRGIGSADSLLAVAIDGFRIDTTLTPPEVLDATAELNINVLKGGQKLLIFQLSRWLQVSNVSVDGAEVEYLQNEALSGSELERLGNDLVTVVMPTTLHPGERHLLRFHYAGAVMQQAAPGLLYVGARGTWYPNQGIEMSRFELKFRWPKPWTLVATGTRTSAHEEGGQELAQWSSEVNIPLAGFNLGKFERASAQTGSAEVASYTTGVVEKPLAIATPELAGESTARNRQIAKRSAEAIRKYEHWFGPYPFKSLSLTQMPGPVSQGWPTLVYLSSFAYLNDEERRTLKLNEFQRLIYDGFMQDHETAHQWWGDQVAWKSYRDQWLMEALANLSALMIMEENHPAQARELIDHFRQELLEKNAAGKSYADAGPVTLGYRLSSSVFPNAYIPVVYGRGLWLLIMLRDYFSDYERAESGSMQKVEGGRFLAALREFAMRYNRSTATTDNFRRLLEEFLPLNARFEGAKKLTWFFDEWVRGSSVPEIVLTQESFHVHGQTATASFSLRQQKCPESLITSVPIYAELVNGERVPLQRVFADGYESHFELIVPRGTRRLLADPEKKLLRR